MKKLISIIAVMATLSACVNSDYYDITDNIERQNSNPPKAVTDGAAVYTVEAVFNSGEAITMGHHAVTRKVFFYDGQVSFIIDTWKKLTLSDSKAIYSKIHKEHGLLIEQDIKPLAKLWVLRRDDEEETRTVYKSEQIVGGIRRAFEVTESRAEACKNHSAAMVTHPR